MTTLNDSNYESPTLDVEAQTSRVHSAPNPLSSPREPNHPSLEDDDSIIESGKGVPKRRRGHIDAGRRIPPGSVFPYGTFSHDKGITSQVQGNLWNCATGAFPEVWYKFKRFETLSLLNLYHYQHELVTFQGELNRRDPKGEMSDHERQYLRKLLKEYCDAIQSIKDISQTTRPSAKNRPVVAATLAGYLRDAHYTDAPDALAMLDITPRALGVDADMIRVLVALRRNVGGSYVRSEKEEYRTPAGKSQPASKTIPPNTRHAFLSQNAEVIIRVLVSAVAAIFLLAPMFALSYIDRKGYRLLTTALFVLLFAVVVPVSSTAKNQKIIVAIAAYAAVLVVFVGQTQAG